MKIKVCGMMEPENMEALAELRPDFMGMIYYRRSKRYLAKAINESTVKQLPRVGVFVNETEQIIVAKAITQQLAYIQLHGKETPEFCARLKAKNLKLIKAFSVDEQFDFGVTKAYEAHCKYFLFDTKGVSPGGNGLIFNWDVLRKYKGELPFFLAGGIGPEHLTKVRNFRHEKFLGIDINSQFELAPGLKNITTLKKFINDLRR